MNVVTLIGRPTKDIEVKYTKTQIAVSEFTLAVDRPVQRGEKAADFIRVKTFGKTAENCGRFMAKGKLVAIEGRIQTGAYQDRDGRTVYITDIIANRVEFIEWKEREKEETPEMPPEEISEDYAVLDEADLPF